MGEFDREAPKINAKLVYFGPAGAGMTTNVGHIHRKMRREHRGELRTEQINDDPASAYEILPVGLGTVQGYETSIDIYTVPGELGLSETRRNILEGADGIVFVADLRPTRHDATVVAVEELRTHLEKHGRSFDDLTLLIQYNQGDLADENALDALHRRLGLKPAATCEAVASEGTGVLQTLTTASKLIFARLRREAEFDAADLGQDPDQDVSDAIDCALPDPGASEEAIGKGFRVEEAGPAEGTAEGIRVPIRLLDEASGRRLELCLRLSIEHA